MRDGSVTTVRQGVSVAGGSEAVASAGPPLAVVPEPRRRWAWTALKGVREVLLVVGVYSLYDLTRFLVAGDHDGAISHGLWLLRHERSWGLDPEHVLNRVCSAHIMLGLPADYAYATLHYIVTPVVLIWMWRAHGPSYGRARTVLMIATILGLIGFSLLPVAPPRLLPGFVDTMAKFSHWGWWSNDASAPRGLGGDTNQFAAMPSLHVGWALWSGWQLLRHGRHTVTRVLGVLYPLVMSVVVLATANHYLLDVVGGVVAVLVAAAVAWALATLAWRLWPGLAARTVAAKKVPARTPPAIAA
jgi:hypothetical protein